MTEDQDQDEAGDLAISWFDQVALMEIRRPPNNHIDLALLTTLADALDDLDSDPRCRCVVLASQGKNFCGGADLNAPRGLASGDGAAISPFYAAAIRVFSTKTPIVAAVQGSCVGAGLGLALACDFRVASVDARFVANFTKLGFHPGFGLSHTLPRLIGAQKAAFMLLTARRVRSDQAFEWGLIDEVAQEGKARDAALRLAQEVADNAPMAVISTRATGRAGLVDAVRAATAHEFAEQQRLMKTEDFREGVKAVSERRTAAFKGR